MLAQNRVYSQNLAYYEIRMGVAFFHDMHHRCITHPYMQWAFGAVMESKQCQVPLVLPPAGYHGRCFFPKPPPRASGTSPESANNNAPYPHMGASVNNVAGVGEVRGGRTGLFSNNLPSHWRAN
ncbi:hypothetical protein DQ04_17151000 [Trypanosoma grayi]|uniref:hypothetical protein n=1 Tax=Trypanosoma grayi TaxID=71804 RepID=UPI0004F40E72|nr:hypothetical protein DQ04_17151000 [Trypanosoma grayi]KEG05939.1 hypothetical protein DQ04_17151000 [Trypanosoma grayi]